MSKITKYLFFAMSLLGSLSAFENYEAAAAVAIDLPELKTPSWLVETETTLFSPMSYREEPSWFLEHEKPIELTIQEEADEALSDTRGSLWLQDEEKDVWLTETLTSSTSSAHEIENKDTLTKNKTHVHTCDYCQKSFPKKGSLIQHIRIHTGEKPYKCNYCEKSFALQGNLTIHIRTHTGEKPYKCNYCEKSFAQKENLKKHLRIHTGEKPFQCDTCGRCFTQKGDLIKHIRIHTGEKLFQCEHCGIFFAENGHLKIHVRTHTGEKPYKCDACGKCFTQTGTLTRHKQIHIGEENNVFSLDFLAPDSHAEAATDLNQQQ